MHSRCIQGVFSFILCWASVSSFLSSLNSPKGVSAKRPNVPVGFSERSRVTLASKKETEASGPLKPKKSKDRSQATKRAASLEDDEDDDDMSMGNVAKQQRLLQKLLASFVDDDEESLGPSTLDSVLRVYCTHVEPSFSTPWQRGQQYSSTSTGFAIAGRRIITNAHSVEYGSLIQVRKRGDDRKYVAEVLAYGPECDLSVLTVKDNAFWEELRPMEFGELPNLLEDVSVIGYPIGGESISVTAGVVSRIDMQEYAQAEMDLLAIQIDAAINAGNSGGPVVNTDDLVVGVAFQSLPAEDAENIGYVVPVDVVKHFLEDVERHGSYTGFCQLGIRFQNLESPALRRHLGMPEDRTGVLVRKIDQLAPAHKLIHKDDVLLTVDGTPIAYDGSIPFRDGERVGLHYYFSQLFKGDVVRMEVFRKGKILTFDVPVWIARWLVPTHLSSKPPSYLTVGGLVFTELTKPYIEGALGEHYTPQTMQDVRMLSFTQESIQYEGQAIVVLSELLEHEINLGYEGFKNSQLLKFNGQFIKNLRHLSQLLDGNKEPQIIFEFHPHQLLVLDCEDAHRASLEICHTHSIPATKSKDLLEDVHKIDNVAPGDNFPTYDHL